MAPVAQPPGGTLWDAAGRARDVAVGRHDELTTALVVSIIRRYLEDHETLHIDDLWPVLDTEDLPPGRYVGKAMQRAQTDGLMAKIPIYGAGPDVYAARKSLRSNGSPKWIYRSLIAADPDPF